MRTYLSAAEIAAQALPSLPASKRGVQLLAARHGWDASPLARPRAGAGGGLEYSIDLLPAEARAAYVGRETTIVETLDAVVRDAGIATTDARRAMLGLADRFAIDVGMPRRRADRMFCDALNLGQLAIPETIKREVKSLDPRTLRRWRRAVADGRTNLTAERAVHKSVLERANDGAVRAYILQLIAKQPQLTAHHVRGLVADHFGELIIGDRRIAIPPVRTFQHALKGWRHAYRNELTAIRDPDGFKARVRFAARVAHPAGHLNEVWQIDASPADVLTTDGRYALYLCEDIYSRRLIGLVTRTPRAAAVGLLMRKAVLAWGVPDRVKTDNGSDFVAHATQRLLGALGIEHETAPPFSPEKKGHIERAIGTLQRDLMRTLPGFIGHSVADRKVIEARKSFAARLGETPEDMFQVTLSAAELQQRVDDWCEALYGHRAHAGLKGRSPFAVAAAAAGPLRRIEDARALDVLLAAVPGKDGLRTVTKTGLRIDGAHYLAGFLNVGDIVLVRMDEADLGSVYVFSPDGLTFLGQAFCPELAGIDPAAAVNAARVEQKRRKDELLAEVKRQPRVRAVDIAPALHRQALADAGRLIPFPKPTEAHDTPALAAARDALAPAPAPSHAEDVLAMQARLLTEERAPNVLQLRKQETDFDRWQRACVIEQALARGEEVGADELLWLGGYREGPEYGGFAATYRRTPGPAEAGQRLTSTGDRT